MIHPADNPQNTIRAMEICQYGYGPDFETQYPNMAKYLSQAAAPEPYKLKPFVETGPIPNLSTPRRKFWRLWN